MVTFHRIPYSVALARGLVQDRMLAELCDSIDRVENVDWGKADQLVRRATRSAGALAVTNSAFESGEKFAMAMDADAIPWWNTGTDFVFRRVQVVRIASICADTHSGFSPTRWETISSRN